MNTSTSNTKASTTNQSDVTEGADKKGSVREQHPDSVAGDKEDKKKQTVVPLVDACSAVVMQPSDPEQGETKNETQSDSEKNLALRFKIYEASQKDITQILSSWDRVQGILLSPLNQEEVRHQAEDQRQHLSSRKSRKDREKERLEKERLEKLKALEDSRLSWLEGEGAEGSARGQDVGVPCLDIQVLSSEDVTRKILESGKLPAAEQVKALQSSDAEPAMVWALVHCVPPSDNSTEPCPGHLMMFHDGFTAAMWLERFSLSLRWKEGVLSVQTSCLFRELPSLEIINNGPRAEQLMVIVSFS